MSGALLTRQRIGCREKSRFGRAIQPSSWAGLQGQAGDRLGAAQPCPLYTAEVAMRLHD
jgi:hypothetical protein